MNVGLLVGHSWCADIPLSGFVVFGFRNSRNTRGYLLFEILQCYILLHDVWTLKQINVPDLLGHLTRIGNEVTEVS